MNRLLMKIKNLRFAAKTDVVLMQNAGLFLGERLVVYRPVYNVEQLAGDSLLAALVVLQV